jgi:pyruvate,water dikinase
MNAPLANSFTLNLDSPLATLEQVGGKGASLARMAAASLPIPAGFHITTDAYRRYVEENRLGERILAEVAAVNENNTAGEASARIQSLMEAGTMPGEIAAAIRRGYEELGADTPVAVRSSATAEDLPEMSFAGQLETYLNVRGGDAVIEAVKRCWASLWTERAIDYRQRQGIGAEKTGMAVLVQRLVPAQAAGVAFTANPVTGSCDEVIINAAWGLGEAVVSGRVTPDTIVIDKRSGEIASQEIADKEVMTTRLQEGTRDEPVPADKRRRSALEPGQAAELARLTVRIEQLYGQPMDIEWALCDGRIFILQARPVTALPEAREALEWKVPREHGRYYRQSVAELLPEPLSPLFTTLALPAWDVATQQIMTSVFGRELFSVSLPTIHGYVYYETVFTPRHVARLIITLPRLGVQIVRFLRGAKSQWAEEARPRYAELAGEWSGRDLAATPTRDLLDGAQDLVAVAADYYLSVQLVLAVANLSEGLFTAFYNRFVKRECDPPAPAFLLGFDSTPIDAEKSLYDLAMWARDQTELADYLARTGSKDLAAAFSCQPAPIAAVASWQEFQRRLAEHLSRFGHAVYDLDFARSVPAEDPSPQLETMKFFLAGEGRNPYERQVAGAQRREQATAATLARLGAPRRRLFTRALGWAQRWVPLREESLADVGLGWQALRRMLREAGQRLAAAGAIAERDQIFWLKWEEVEEAVRRVDSGQPADDFRAAIAERQRIWKSERGLTPPVALPVKSSRILGIDFSDLMPAHTSQAASHFIRGIGASPGKVTAPACVIHGQEEFDRMRPGNILVAKITTPAWTPLFAMASGIVTDVGGPLSHSSIVAREYGVPAVLATGVATQRIHHGQIVTVDGNRGVVTFDG